MADKKPERKDQAYFLRLSGKELEIVETAIKLKYGAVEGFKSHFARYAMLTVAKAIIKDYQNRRREQ